MCLMVPAVLTGISTDTECDVETKCDTAVWSCRKCVQNSGTVHRSTFFRETVVSPNKVLWGGLNAFSPDRQWKSDSVRINLCRCSVAAGNKPLPVTNRACHFQLSVRLLVFHMCSSGSFAASEIIICKDEGLSGEATGLWEQPFCLHFSATTYFFLLQSFHLCLLYLAYSAAFHHIYLFDLLFI